MRKHFIFINDSTGELDWIAPYLKSLDETENLIYVCLSLPRFNTKRRNTTYLDYFKDTRINHYNISKYTHRILRVEFFIERVFAHLIPHRVINLKLNSFISTSLSFLVPMKCKNFSLCYIDYNLKEKSLYKAFLRKNPKSKVVIFPHSTALMTNSIKTPKPKKTKKIRCDLFLENTKYNSAFNDYSDVMAVVGSPTLDVFRNIDKKSIEKSILILTRRFESTFAMAESETLNNYSSIVKYYSKMGYIINVKHHPRDTQTEKWNLDNDKYQIIKVSEDISRVKTNFSAVFSVYSSAPVLFASRGIPTFDFTAYKGTTEALPYHYLDKDNNITHELIELGIIKKIDNITEQSLSIIQPSELKDIGLNQKEMVNQIFGHNAAKKIQDKIDALF